MTLHSIGLFAALELVKDRKTREPVAPMEKRAQVMAAFRQKCLEQGLFLYTHWQNVLILPPLIITEEELGEGLRVGFSAQHI